MKPDEKSPDFFGDLEGDDEVEILEVVGVDLEEVTSVPTPASRADGAERESILLDDEKGPARGPDRVATTDAPPEPGDRLTDKEQLLRMRADYENLLKRLERERHDFEQFANSTLVSRLLPVLDNFERAMHHRATRSDEDDAFCTGVGLIYQHLLDELRKEGLTPIDSVGHPFDPTIHDAVATDVAMSVHDNNTVVEQLQRGYLFRDRVLRPALVKVGLVNEASRDPNEGA
jgi:molecular chaperone GrpE